MLFRSAVASHLNAEDRQLIGSVWQAYKGYAATSLRDMSHSEAPWLESRKGLNAADRGGVEITRDSMKQFFGRLAKANK